MFLLDTDTCSFAMKRSSGALDARLRGFAPGELGVSVVTVYELEYGIAKRDDAPRLRRIVDAFLRNVRVHGFDAAAARRAGAVRARLSRAGTPIGAYDLLIAGHALALDATLVTHNRAEFRRVEGLAVEDWA